MNAGLSHLLLQSRFYNEFGLPGPVQKQYSSVEMCTHHRGDCRTVAGKPPTMTSQSSVSATKEPS